MHSLRRCLVMVTFCWLADSAGIQAAPPVRDYQPDPKAVQRYGQAYRYPQAGWIVLHIEGKPYERGYQHGRLLAPEIAAFVHNSATLMSHEAPATGWRNARTLINALFLRRFEKEYLEEMKGIADGAAAAGAKYDNRAIDLVDIVGVNVWPEIETLPSALEATPTGLEGIKFPQVQPRPTPPAKPMHCSAFAANGSATADGKIVFGHITMFGLYPARFYNVWLDVKPENGHRVLMQSYPGGIQSGMDYYLNDAGLLVTETTIAQTTFDINGKSVGSRIRQALQYADSIDQAVEILKSGNNGLYTNEWLLADIKTNEIAMFELGTAKSKLYRSSKNEWFGGTEGFYWGCNNTKDLDVRLETIASVNDRPANVVFCPSDRDKTWQALYQQHKGKIDADFGKLAFTTPPLAAYHSLDAKFTTSSMAKELKTWALFGPPLGRTWQPSQQERQRYADIKPLVSNPWTILHPQAPPTLDPAGGPVAVDVPEKTDGEARTVAAQDDEHASENKPAWHGTLLPKTNADIWLAAAFADYERIVAREHGMEKRRHSDLTDRQREQLGLSLFAYRSSYLTGAASGHEVPLAETHSFSAESDWYRMASGKGVLLLHELRRLLGGKVFDEAMEAFGRAHAGKEVTAAEFQAHMENKSGKKLDEFFSYWLTQAGIPRYFISHAKVTHQGKGYVLEGKLGRTCTAPEADVPLTIVTTAGQEQKLVPISTAESSFTFETTLRPVRLVLDKFGTLARANGGPFSIYSFYGELAHTLIVYGTADEEPSNREAAEDLQKAIIQRHANFTVPIKSDRAVTDEEVKAHHVLLIGRPDSNTVLKRFAADFPIQFGSRSFVVVKETYAHPGSAVLAATVNPLNKRFSLVAFTGLSAEATLHSIGAWQGRGDSSAEVIVLPNTGKPKALVVPAKDLVKELDLTLRLTSQKTGAATAGQ